MKHDLKHLDVWDDYHGDGFYRCRRCGESGWDCCDTRWIDSACPSNQLELLDSDLNPMV